VWSGTARVPGGRHPRHRVVHPSGGDVGGPGHRIARGTGTSLASVDA